MSTTWATVSYDIKQEDQVQVTLADDGSVTEQLTIHYVAETDGTGRGTPVEALTASDGATTMPAAGSIISSGGQAFTVKQVQPRRTGPFSFDVQIQGIAKYSPPQTNAKNAITIRFSGQSFTQDAHYDSTGKAVLNSAGQTFDPSVTQTFYDERIEVSYTTTTDQSAAFASVRGCVNSSALTFNIRGCSRSYPARCLKCEDVQQSETVPLQDATIVYQVTASFTARSDGYTTMVFDQGLYRIDTSANGSSGSTTITPILDSANKPVTQPVPLDGTGQPLALPSSTTGTYTASGATTPVDSDAKSLSVTGNWIAFKLESEADFTSVFTGLS